MWSTHLANPIKYTNDPKKKTETSTVLDRIMISVDHWDDPTARDPLGRKRGKSDRVRGMSLSRRAVGAGLSAIEKMTLGTMGSMGTALSGKLRGDKYALSRMAGNQLQRIAGRFGVIGHSASTAMLKHFNFVKNDAAFLRAVGDAEKKQRSGKPTSNDDILQSVIDTGNALNSRFENLVDAVSEIEPFLKASDDRIKILEDNNQKAIDSLRDNIGDWLKQNMPGVDSQVDNISEDVRRVKDQVFEHESKLADLQKDISWLKNNIGPGGGGTVVTISGLDAANDNTKRKINIPGMANVTRNLLRRVADGAMGVAAWLGITKGGGALFGAMAGALNLLPLPIRFTPMGVGIAAISGFTYWMFKDNIDALVGMVLEKINPFTKENAAAIGRQFTGKPDPNSKNTRWIIDENGNSHPLDVNNRAHQEIMKKYPDRILDKKQLDEQKKSIATLKKYEKEKKEFDQRMAKWNQLTAMGIPAGPQPTAPTPPTIPRQFAPITPQDRTTIQRGYVYEKMGTAQSPRTRGTFRGAGGRGGWGGADLGDRSDALGAAAGNKDENAKLLAGMSPTQAALLRGIATTETHLREKEAYSEALNRPGNNANVRRFGYDKGADHGFFQNNQMDVDRLTKSLIEEGKTPEEAYEIARHLNGGGRGGKSTMAQQMNANAHFLRLRHPKLWKDLESPDPQVRARAGAQIQQKMSNFWFGLRDRPGDFYQQFRKGLEPGATVESVMPELFKDPTTAVGPDGKQRVKQSQPKVAGIRKRPISDQLQSKINGTLQELEKKYPGKSFEFEVTSGGQAPKGSGGRRTGSTRHDDRGQGGGAADGDVWVVDKKTGERRRLSLNNRRDYPMLYDFFRGNAKRGVTGQGMGREYMGANRIHVGGGREASWGSAARPGSVFGRAIAEGRSEREAFALAEEERRRLELEKKNVAENKPKPEVKPASAVPKQEVPPVAAVKPAEPPIGVKTGSLMGPLTPEAAQEHANAVSGWKRRKARIGSRAGEMPQFPASALAPTPAPQGDFEGEDFGVPVEDKPTPSPRQAQDDSMSEYEKYLKELNAGGDSKDSKGSKTVTSPKFNPETADASPGDGGYGAKKMCYI